jgi:hypothetical protein
MKPALLLPLIAAAGLAFAPSLRAEGNDSCCPTSGASVKSEKSGEKAKKAGFSGTVESVDAATGKVTMKCDKAQKSCTFQVGNDTKMKGVTLADLKPGTRIYGRLTDPSAAELHAASLKVGDKKAEKKAEKQAAVQ